MNNTADIITHHTLTRMRGKWQTDTKRLSQRIGEIW